MEMILNENDLVVGARFENGTIQDYIDEKKLTDLFELKNQLQTGFYSTKMKVKMICKNYINKF